jgi:hypothetical protein
LSCRRRTENHEPTLKMPESYEEKLARLRAKPIVITGADPREIGIIRSALVLYRTRNFEKDSDQPGMGWGKAAETAEELEIRITT